MSDGREGCSCFGAYGGCSRDVYDVPEFKLSNLQRSQQHGSQTTMQGASVVWPPILSFAVSYVREINDTSLGGDMCLRGRRDVRGMRIRRETSVSKMYVWRVTQVWEGDMCSRGRRDLWEMCLGGRRLLGRCSQGSGGVGHTKDVLAICSRLAACIRISTNTMSI